MNVRKLATLVAAVALTAGLFGAGISAQYTDSATAVQNVSVGTFACSVTSADPHAVVTGNSVTVTLPEIEASASSNYLFDVTVHNIGSIPAVVTWAAVTSGTITFQPAGRMGYAMGTSGDPMNVPLSLAGGASHTYAGAIGFMWATLINDDLGKTATVTYTASCANTPAPPPPTSHISFVGFANALGHAALNLPAGSQPGDLAVVMTYGPSSSPYAGNPTGYTGVNFTVLNRTYLSYRILQAGDTAVPSTTAGTGKSVAVYRGATGIGANTYSGTSSGLPPESASYPLYTSALSSLTASGPLQKSDGSSWVGIMTYDSGNGTYDIRQETFNKVISTTLQVPPYTPAVLDGPITVNRSAGAAAQNIGLADSNGGVASWANGSLTVMGGLVMPISSTTHTTETYSFELLSN